MKKTGICAAKSQCTHVVDGKRLDFGFEALNSKKPAQELADFVFGVEGVIRMKFGWDKCVACCEVKRVSWC